MTASQSAVSTPFGEFVDVQEACRSHLERYPDVPPPFVGSAYFQLSYANEDFESQDIWNEWRLRDQQDLYSVHVDREHCCTGMKSGLPFEAEFKRLYFQAQEQLVHVMNALQDLLAERLREKSQEFARTWRSRSI